MLGLYKIVLGPLLLWQARTIRRTALRLPEAAGPRTGVAGEPVGGKPLRLLFVGDSSAAGVGVGHQNDALAAQAASFLAARIGAPVTWQLVAKSGINTNEALHLVAASELEPADLLVTALGVNDVTTQRSSRQFVSDYRALVETVMRKAGAKAVIITGLPPMHILPSAPQPLRWYLGQCAKRLDANLQQWVRANRCFAYIPLQWAAKPREMASDGYHPGAGQYWFWAHLVAESAEMLLQQNFPPAAPNR
jgi:lysophospholipase L1-like esterase